MGMGVEVIKKKLLANGSLNNSVKMYRVNGYENCQDLISITHIRLKILFVIQKLQLYSIF